MKYLVFLVLICLFLKTNSQLPLGFSFSIDSFLNFMIAREDKRREKILENMKPKEAAPKAMDSSKELSSAPVQNTINNNIYYPGYPTSNNSSYYGAYGAEPYTPSRSLSNSQPSFSGLGTGYTYHDTEPRIPTRSLFNSSYRKNSWT